jgi:hypothetical protein
MEMHVTKAETRRRQGDKTDQTLTAKEQQQRERQRELVAWISKEMHDGDGTTLVPLFERGPFGPPTLLPLEGIWLTQESDASLSTVAWWAVAQKLIDATERFAHIIDHAWSFGHASPPHEAWGFVTEPYMDQDDAQAAIAVALCRTGLCSYGHCRALARPGTRRPRCRSSRLSSRTASHRCWRLDCGLRLGSAEK